MDVQERLAELAVLVEDAKAMPLSASCLVNRSQVLDLIEASRPVAEIAQDLGVSDQRIYNWRRQDRVDRGLVAEVTTAEQPEFPAAHKRLRKLEAELEVHRRATGVLKGESDGSVDCGSLGDQHSIGTACEAVSGLSGLLHAGPSFETAEPSASVTETSCH